MSDTGDRFVRIANLLAALSSEFEAMAADGCLTDPIETLDLNIREKNAIVRLGVKTVGELATYTARDLVKLKNFGQLSLSNVRSELQARGLRLRGDAKDEQ